MFAFVRGFGPAQRKLGWSARGLPGSLARRPRRRLAIRVKYRPGSQYIGWKCLTSRRVRDAGGQDGDSGIGSPLCFVVSMFKFMSTRRERTVWLAIGVRRGALILGSWSLFVRRCFYFGWSHEVNINKWRGGEHWI